jgi:uncharacterized membrane protein YfcA
MNIDPAFAGFALCVALAFTTEAAIGFGSMLLALTLGAHFYPITTILPWLVCMSVTMTTYIVGRHRRHAAWRVLGTRILPGMGAGMVVGYLVSGSISEFALRSFLAVFVIATALVELRRLLRPGTGAPPAALSPSRFAVATFAAGIVHGITATGGPILVYGLGRLGLDKSAFRATLAAVWWVLNGTLAAGFYARGQLTGDDVPYILALAPVVFGSIVMGELLHGRFDERTFRLVVLVMLMIAGVSLLL